MKVILDESSVKAHLYPFTATRPVCDIRVGILTIREKWQYGSNFQVIEDTGETAPASARTFNAGIIPSPVWLNRQLDIDEKLTGALIARDDEVKLLAYPWQIFQLNDWAIRKDFELITAGRSSQKLSETNQVIGKGSIFLEEGATVEHSILNTSTGPVYIGKNAEVMEGCMIRGPFALCESAVLKMGAKVYGATTIGPYCNAGGEIKNSVMFGYSNKGHDGYLGDSVIGEW